MFVNYLTLVNKENPIKDNYFKNLELVECYDVFNESIQIEKRTLTAYLELKDFLEKKNIYIGLDSAYRTIEMQQKIIDEFNVLYGEEYVNNYVAPVRRSEHHTGLAVDLSIKVGDQFLILNEELMANEKIFLEIHKYLKDFGFILRYPKGKEKITGYSYEPWHIRYVGKIVADIIYKNHWTLEEYFTKFSGVLVINKEKNMTSFDVVHEISRIFGIKKVGHTGTLDPMAEGVLVITLGQATKIAELLTAYQKEYIASAVLGILTDTLDITGKVIDKKNVQLSINIEKELMKYKKTYMQEVPNYSAVKVAGKKLYEYARNNEKIDLPKKKVTIFDILFMNMDNNQFTFKATVSKGCYIRSLIRDIGFDLGTYATMTKLIRIRQGNFSIDDAYFLDDIKNNQFHVISIEDALNYPIVQLDSFLSMKARNGVRIRNQYNILDKVIFKDMNGQIIGIFQVDGDYLKTWKNFYNI